MQRFAPKLIEIRTVARIGKAGCPTLAVLTETLHRRFVDERESSWPVHARRVDNQSADTVWRVTIEAAHTTAVVAKDVIGLSLLAYVVGSPNTSHPERPAPVQATSISQQVGHARLLFAS